jgi:hypothetical protein
MPQFDRETSQLASAAAQLTRDRAALLRPDGQPKYSADEHAERDRALLERFTATADTIFGTVDAARAAAEQTLDALEHSDPMDRLDASTLGVANAKAGFIREEAQRMDLGALAERCRQVLAHGDQVDKVLWLRYGEWRREDLRGTAGAAHNPAALTVLYDALKGLAAAVGDPKAGEKRASAEATLKAAREWSHAAHRKRVEADGTMDRMMAQMRARYSL